MDTDKFHRYQEEFNNAYRNSVRLLKQLNAANGVVDTVISVSVDIESELSEAEGYLKAMEIEFRSMMTGDKRTIQNKLNDYSEDLRRLFADYKKTKQEAQEKALKTGTAARAKLTQNNQVLDNSTRVLENSRMLVAQTDQIGGQILSDMGSQREKLEGAYSNIQDTKGYAASAKSVLNMMTRRAIVHQLLIYFTIVVLFGLICIVIYYGFSKK